MNQRLNVVLAAAAVTGVAVGLVVAAFEYVAAEILLEAVFHRPLWQQALAPAIGLALTAALLRWAAFGATPSTSEEFVKNFHDPHRRLDGRPVAGRLAAGAATIGFGGAMGLEGPAIYAGSAIGSAIQHRFSKYFSREDAKVLLVAGAAAGVAAVFKTPATGVIFALEAPFQDDVARRALLPSLVSAASAYIVFVAFIGTEVVFPVFGAVTDFGRGELAGAILIGVLAGGGARLFAMLIARAKSLSTTLPWWFRVPVGGAALGSLAVLSAELSNFALTLGPGREVQQLIRPTDTLALIVGMFIMRMAATTITVAAGGAGGLFIPLAVQGLLVGRFVAGVLDQPDSALFPVLGLAAFLGAGYRTPLASVMFVAESTGNLFVVPALVAAAVSQVVVGRQSVSPAQRLSRTGHLERRFDLPITTALETDVLTVPPDATAAEFVFAHVMGRRTREVAVVDKDTYLGMCRFENVSRIPQEEWDDTTVAAILRADLPVGRPTWTLRQAMAAMETADVDRLAVTDDDMLFIGMVSAREILELDEILDETER